MAREVRCHQTDRRKDRQTEGRTDGLTHRPTTVTLAAHARRGLIYTLAMVRCIYVATIINSFTHYIPCTGYYYTDSAEKSAMNNYCW